MTETVAKIRAGIGEMQGSQPQAAELFSQVLLLIEQSAHMHNEKQDRLEKLITTIQSQVITLLSTKDSGPGLHHKDAATFVAEIEAATAARDRRAEGWAACSRPSAAKRLIGVPLFAEQGGQQDEARDGRAPSSQDLEEAPAQPAPN